MILMMSKLSSMSSLFEAAELEPGELEVVGYRSESEGRFEAVLEIGLDSVEVVSQPMKAKRGCSASNEDGDEAPVSDTEELEVGDEDDGGSSKLLAEADEVTLPTITPTVSRILDLEMPLGVVLTTSRSLSVEDELEVEQMSNLVGELEVGLLRLRLLCWASNP